MTPSMSKFVLLTLAAFGLLSTRMTSAVMIPVNNMNKIVGQSRSNHVGTAVMSSGSNRHLPLAMAIPGYGVTEQIFVGGFQNFLSIFNAVITARILLSWFPQAQGVALLQPVYAVTDPYLNLFRGIIPPVFGLDLSPIAAFFTLSVAGNAVAAVGCELPPGPLADNAKKMQQRMNSSPLNQAWGKLQSRVSRINM
eukprot:CAMPEP_0195506878 /NCGR_PEP_ID=MMETSP0794_2-20130614/422_1 /TAXON_ID=515487 /ORGANISM="Stephanopyxis turris, Strain CCMP 815" /LENGTH=194 /DNA_ID=CAMNT_0040633343 /DNA_START=123 /DNA_END=707 /DNA_ORIENTATION=+